MNAIKIIIFCVKYFRLSTDVVLKYIEIFRQHVTQINGRLTKTQTEGFAKDLFPDNEDMVTEIKNKMSSKCNYFTDIIFLISHLHSIDISCKV